MLNEKLLVEKAKEYYKKSYGLLEKDFLKMVEESKTNVPNSKVAIEAFQRGFEQGIIQGREQDFRMKQDADGCVGCAFEDRSSWEAPCDRCCKNSEDYWRAKRTLAEMEK